VLFSVHGEDLPVFRLLRLRARRIPALIEDAKDVLLKLYDADAEYSPTRWRASTTAWRR
jgi:magnesium transporter